MTILLIIAGICLIVSLIADRNKTWLGIKKGLKMFLNISPVIISVLILVSVVLFLLPNEIIVQYLGKDAGFSGYFFAAIIGSVALIPGFIAYPLAGLLVKNGVSYPVIAVFVTTLMMVGILTLPIEIKFFGVKTAILRNVLYFIGAIIIGVFVGLIYSI
ncbi:MAG: permease [Bacteroidales bacterium]